MQDDSALRSINRRKMDYALLVCPMDRRHFLVTIPSLAAARTLLAADGRGPSRIGLCSFSCHQQWKAVAKEGVEVKFHDAAGFYRYARELGADGVQTTLRSTDPVVAKAIRALGEESGGYYEGDLRLPKSESDLAAFEREVRLAREAGATVARAVFTGGRRYEIFKTAGEFRSFHENATKTLTWIEPILQKHRLKVAFENHKDHRIAELIALMHGISSEWIGVLIDTGNNIALLEDPDAVVAALAPFALSVHLKDMAVQPHEDGFLLSEVIPGTGMLDLPGMIATLKRENPALVFNLEMATRDPLLVPCLRDDYYVTFPTDYRTRWLDAAMERIRSNPPRAAVPVIAGKAVGDVIREEESNNRAGLEWMRERRV
jgi:sugar phosphate isomerase/epimerase